MNKIIDELNESNLKRITHIIAVLNSCETFVQVENTFNWGQNIIASYVTTNNKDYDFVELKFRYKLKNKLMDILYEKYIQKKHELSGNFCFLK